MTVDTADNIYLAGYNRGVAIDFDPSEATALLTPSNLAGTGLRDGFLASLTSAGQFRWVNKVGGIGGDVVPQGVDVSKSNQVTLSGRFRGSVDFDPNSGTQVLSSVATSAMLLTLNPTLGVTVSRTKGVVTSEAGRTASVEISLDSAPTADVTLSVASDDLSEGSLSVSSLTFTSANWNVPQVVSVAGVNDLVVDGDIAYMINFSRAVSLDPRYNGMQAASVSVTNLDDELPTKFYVVNDDSQNLTYEYDALGGLVESYNLNSGNTTPRGAASTLAGDKTWVVDANRKVYAYNTSGGLLGSWTAGTLSSTAIVEGITTNGTDVWIVDNKADRVYRYSNAAGRTTGSQNAVSNFSLNGSNSNPKDIVTDGTHLWVVNDSTTDKVFKYTLTGALVGSWTIDSFNKSPTGITLDPSPGSQSLWIVDNGTDRVYEYANARSGSLSSQAASVTFALAAGNTNPQGIADPPPSATRLTTSVSSLARDPSLPEFPGSASVPLIEVASTSLGFVSSTQSERTRSNFQSEIDSKLTPLQNAGSRSTANASAFAQSPSLYSAAKVMRSTSASDHDAVFGSELFDELDTSLLDSLATVR